MTNNIIEKRETKLMNKKMINSCFLLWGQLLELPITNALYLFFSLIHLDFVSTRYFENHDKRKQTFCNNSAEAFERVIS